MKQGKLHSLTPTDLDRGRLSPIFWQSLPSLGPVFLDLLVWLCMRHWIGWNWSIFFPCLLAKAVKGMLEIHAVHHQIGYHNLISPTISVCLWLLLCRRRVLLRMISVKCAMPDHRKSIDSNVFKNFQRVHWIHWKASGLRWFCRFYSLADSLGPLCAGFHGSPGPLVLMVPLVLRVHWFPGFHWCSRSHSCSWFTSFLWFLWCPWFPWFLGSPLQCSTGSPGSRGSLFGSMVAVGSMGSIGSMGFVDSVAPIGSLGSISSVGSTGCVGSLGYVGFQHCSQSRRGECFAPMFRI